ncbi:MAG TPA: hypothetical protein VK633_10070, partial [Verrucomicrobiae bacterium]|nr:hypothetical protein [Verrucomicrobiae bacterium]
MALLLVIGGCGCWVIYQHWMRLDREKSAWRDSFWNWVVRGFCFPVIIWSLANIGFGDRFPPLVPSLADAQNSKLPWLNLWLGVSLAGAILILTYWVAVTCLWMIGVMSRQ